MTIKMLGPFNSGLAVGNDTEATANTDTDDAVNGIVKAVYVRYNGSPPAGSTDVVMTTKGTSPAAPAQTLLSIANAATDGWFYPRPQIHTTAGAAVAAQYDPAGVPVCDTLNVLIAGANAGDSADVWLMVDR